jgi:RNA polymerase sigma factor (sigma-70 family)
MTMTEPLGATVPHAATATACTTATASDGELIDAVRAGDTQAYGTLYERHAAAARRLASQFVRGSADAEDVVAETFTRVLRVIRRGGGPAEAFRPYLLTAVRRVACDQLRGQRTQIPTDDLPDPGQPFVDPAVASLERSLIARAFMSLPERWTAVLWHTEIEQARPAEIALVLGLTPNAVAALSYRAREGLRQAYLQMHLSVVKREECRPVAGQLGAHVRGALSRRDRRRVDNHLRGCADCEAAHAELTSINGSLRGMLGPIFLGGAAAAYLSASGGHAAAASAATASGPAGSMGGSGMGGSGMGAAGLRWLRAAVLHRPVLPAAAGVLFATVTIPAATLTHGHLPPARLAKPGGSSVVRQLPSSAVSPGASPVSPLSVPTPASTPASTPGNSPTATPRPSPTPAASSPLVSARLGVKIDVTGLLGLGLAAVVDVQVADSGGAASADLTASLTLPAGTMLLGLAGSGPQTWTCTAIATGASCVHGPIAAGAATTAAVRILVVSLSGCGNPVLATVTSGALSASGQSASRVRC